jgi:long-chain fatty acid transport protein
LGAYQYSDNFDFAEPIDPADIDASKSGLDQAIRSNAIGPNVGLFFASPVVKDRFAMGGGIYIPYAAVVNAPHDGPQRWAARNVLLASAHATLSAAVKLHDVISIGGGVSYVLSGLSLTKVQDFAGVDTFGDSLGRDPINQDNDFGSDAPSTVRELDVLARDTEIDLSAAHSVSFNAGVALRPIDRLDLALVYQHGARARFNGRFRLDMNDDFFTQDLAAQGLQYPPLVEGDAEITIRLPKRITLGVGIDVHERVRLEATGQYVLYRSFDEVDILLRSPDLAQPELGLGPEVRQPLRRDWTDVGIAELTTKIRATDKLGFTVLAGYHSPASPDSTVDMASPDGHRLIYGVGLGYAVSEKTSLLVDFEGHSLIPRRVTTSDYDLGNGTYRLFIAHIGITAQAKFGIEGRGGDAASKPTRRWARGPSARQR